MLEEMVPLKRRIPFNSSYLLSTLPIPLDRYKENPILPHGKRAGFQWKEEVEGVGSLLCLVWRMPLWSTWKKEDSKLILDLIMIGLTIAISSDGLPGFREGEDTFYVGPKELPMWWHCSAAPQVTAVNRNTLVLHRGQQNEGTQTLQTEQWKQRAAPLPTESKSEVTLQSYVRLQTR